MSNTYKEYTTTECKCEFCDSPVSKRIIRHWNTGNPVIVSENTCGSELCKRLEETQLHESEDLKMQTGKEA